MPNPYVLLALVLAWGASCAAAYYKGGEHRENALIAERAERAREDAERQAKVAAIAAKRRADGRAIDNALDDEVYRYVANDAARAACFDDDGLQLFNANAAGVPVRGHGSRAAVPARAADREGR